MGCGNGPIRRKRKFLLEEKGKWRKKMGMEAVEWGREKEIAIAARAPLKLKGRWVNFAAWS